MTKRSDKKSIYKMLRNSCIHTNDLQTTIKLGIILYIVLAMLVIPSGICSQQHRLPDFEIPMLDLNDIAPISALLIIDLLPELNSEDPENEIDEALFAPAKATDPAPEAQEPPFYRYIMLASETYEVDAALIRAIILAESGYNPQAVSKRGAQGLMQLMPSTARWLGVENSFDPEHNIDAGVRYFRQLLDRFKGDVRLALAAYNAGSRYVRKYGGVPPFRATQLYIKKVLKYQQIFENEMALTETATSAV